MTYDIYGNNLRPGHCEVHPHIHECYPCSACMAESRTSYPEPQQEPQQEPDQAQYLEYYLEQADEELKARTDRIKALESVIQEFRNDLHKGKDSIYLHYKYDVEFGKLLENSETVNSPKESNSREEQLELAISSAIMPLEKLAWHLKMEFFTASAADLQKEIDKLKELLGKNENINSL